MIGCMEIQGSGKEGNWVGLSAYVAWQHISFRQEQRQQGEALLALGAEAPERAPVELERELVAMRAVSGEPSIEVGGERCVELDLQAACVGRC